MSRLRQRTDWLIGLLVTGAILLLAMTGALRPVEGIAYDLAARMAGSDATGGRVLVVAIDDRSLAEVGPWPWSRYTLGEINSLVAAGDPRVKGYALPFETPQNEHGQQTLQNLYEHYGDNLSSAGQALFERAIRDLGTDRVLAATFERTGRVVLGVRYATSSHPPGSPPALPAGISADVVHSGTGTDALRAPARLRPEQPLYPNHIHAPVEQIARAARASGLGERRDASPREVNRELRLVLPYGEEWLPSLPLLLYAYAGAGGDEPEIRVWEDGGVEVNGRMFDTGPAHVVYPQPSAPTHTGVTVVSAADVLARNIAPEVFRDRVVLVGLTAAGLTDVLPAPLGPDLAAVERFAGQVAALLDNRLYDVPDWAVWGRLAAFILVALYLALVLPRLGVGAGLAVSALLLVVLLNTQLLLKVLESVWLPLMAPILALILGHMLLAGKRNVVNRIAGFQAELSAANLELGETHRQQGRLDDAFRCLGRCRPDDDVIEALYQLGMDYERRRRFNRAGEVFRWLLRHRPGHRDVRERIEHNDNLHNQASLGRAGSMNSTQTLVLTDDAVQKPMLGRYEIIEEIGKGAMGVVYLGRDPKIGRTVAIKTLALDTEFEGEALSEARDRFQREAETAGRLRHPNIVVIHDVGDDHDLAWIAMDYLEGVPLSHFTEVENLLPPGEVFGIAAQVADALQTAHDEGVVHRDIKPGNIIYDRDRGIATVTDFGVARITDHQQTRTGIVLGTPSYMSPEQLSGETVDGLSDVFSLGVTLYQLLIGQRPFTGESLSSLMYRIANERHRDVRRIRPELPACASTITNRAMAKKRDQRYVSAAQMARALRRCRERAEADD